MSKIAMALADVTTDIFADKLKEVAAAPGGISDYAARSLASEAVQRAAGSSEVRAAIVDASPQPIAWQESQAIWGALLAIAPTLLVVVGRLAGVAIAEGEAAELVAQVTALAGGALALYGRVTTTRPIAGTAAAERVAAKAA